MSALSIIGDDLTGAMDTGVFFAKRYPRVGVIFDGRFIGDMAGEYDALIIDTESRNISSREAYDIVYGYAETLRKVDLKLIYKKIDSTLRGNVGRELEAILAGGRFDMAALVPALPLNGRTTLDGMHYLNGRLLTESDLASDPFSPVTSAYIPDIVRGQTAVKTAVVGLRDIRCGTGHLSAVLDGLNRTGCKIAVMDAEDEEDLDRISAALGGSTLRILPCGSAGLFSRMYAGGPSNAENMKLKHAKNDKPLLVISGSPARTSKLQIEYAGAHGENVNVIKLDGAVIAAGPDTAALNEADRVKSLALEYLGAGRNVVIDGAGAGKKDLFDIYRSNPWMLAETSGRIRDALADIAGTIADGIELSGLMIFGGDTALSICRRLGTRAINILGEVEPLVPFGVFAGGRLDNVPVITKAGGFGNDDIIIKTIAYFRR